MVEGRRFEFDDVTYVVEPFELGPLVLPTGEIVGCDPLVSHTTPFVDTVEPGTYPLRAWVAVLHKDQVEWQRRIAALQLVIVDEPVASWTMAAHADQDVASLDEDSYFGYGVDAGTGTLADRVTIETLQSWDFDRIDETFIPAQIPLDPIEAVISAVVDENTGANVYVVGSGWGDGSYATYVGWTADGCIATFVTDFQVLPDA
ncbi:DUF4241 domain-containing protein [Luedemannella flava]|uniref:DUF4241 domain-containing protein n=1 Tax=Luedemannella flava TaxID=349316 RepID=A0ABN2MC03_9ACTN